VSSAASRHTRSLVRALASVFLYSGTLARVPFLAQTLGYSFLALISTSLSFGAERAAIGIAVAAYLFSTAFVKRLRFQGNSWAWVFLAAIPFAGWVALGIMTCRNIPDSPEPGMTRWQTALSSLAAAAFLGFLFLSLSVAGMTPSAPSMEPAAPTLEPSAPTASEEAKELEDIAPPRGADTTAGDVEEESISPAGIPVEGMEIAAGREEVEALLASLPVAAEQPDGYDRDLFGRWLDQDGDGCDTRREVLIQESLSTVTVSAGCQLAGGQWLSLYDGEESVEASDFDIDHVVPLKEAWDSGAVNWDDDRRADFANDLSSPNSLIAVSASSNRSKGANDPSQWLPPSTSYRCTYIASWIEVKATWLLTVDPMEKETLLREWSTC